MWGSRVKNLATNFWLSRGQHPANVDGHYAAGPRPGGVQTPAYYHAGVRSGHATEQPMSVIIVQTDRGARHCLGLVVGGLRDGSSPSGDIFVAGQNIIIRRWGNAGAVLSSEHSVVCDSG